MSGHYETVGCNLCGSLDQQIVYKKPDELFNTDEWFTVVECSRCGLGFVNPRPFEEDMPNYYPREFYNSFEDQKEYHENRYARELNIVKTALGPSEGRPRLLDVGCANGGFPRFARANGFDVEGVEIAINSLEIADFPVYRSTLSDIPVNAPTYDIVTAWAVLEHVHDPMSYFRKVGRILKPGGAFVFLVTNFSSISSKALYREDLPRHLHFFSTKTITSYLEKNGLELRLTTTDDSIYEMAPVHWLRYYLRKAVGLPQMQWAERPPTRIEYIRTNKLSSSFVTSLRYAVRHPLTTFDRAIMPLYAKIQKLTGTYGIQTYVARKR